MSAENAENFFLNYVYQNLDREEALRKTQTDEEFSRTVVQMAQEEGWPTGEFNENDLKVAGDAFALARPEIYATYESIINLLRQGRIGGTTEVY